MSKCSSPHRSARLQAVFCILDSKNRRGWVEATLAVIFMGNNGDIVTVGINGSIDCEKKDA